MISMGRVRTYDLPILERVYQDKANEKQIYQRIGRADYFIWSEANTNELVYKGLTKKSARSTTDTD